MNFEPSPKDYPYAKELATFLKEFKVVQVGGTQDERLTEDFRQNLSFPEVGELIKESDTAICVDSYLQHHYWYLNKKAIVLWGISDPVIFGHDMHINLLKDRNYLRQNQFDLYYRDQYKPEAFVCPEDVMEVLQGMNL